MQDKVIFFKSGKSLFILWDVTHSVSRGTARRALTKKVVSFISHAVLL